VLCFGDEKEFAHIASVQLLSKEVGNLAGNGICVKLAIDGFSISPDSGLIGRIFCGESMFLVNKI
jgi:hypothetical protein